MSLPWQKTKEGRFIYGRNAGSPGHLEDKTLCIVSVSPPDRYGSFHQAQCRFKRGKGKDGLFCGIHAKRYPNGLGNSK